ncbi:SRPBCC family protein [Salsipaludibacter albus]|uniref:SRPBCC family protein n=1 Tax=Salsipaludibacter albus TaxID=2849650 RepID=UPI001EE4CB89|nr:SRPBCC family protein [Salsipaludibacter albus]MBY5161641.1 SRPBCC family protein [Salsipaludibacter albus]
MGQKVSDTVVIDATPDEVLAVILDLEAYPEWSDDVNSVDVVSTDGQGRPRDARFDVDARVAQVDYVLRYDYDGPADVQWSLLEGEVLRQLDGSYTLVDRDGSTHVTYALEVDISMPVPGFIKKRAARTILDTGLKGLKARVEST